MSRHPTPRLAIVVLAALFGTTAVPAWAAGAPVPLSTGGEGWEATAGIDAQGNAVALWDERTSKVVVQDRLWSKSRPAAGDWSARSVVSPALQTTGVYPVLHTTAAGDSIAIWNDQAGVWTADRDRQGAWSPARLLIAGAASPLFVMNAQGDAALAWGAAASREGATQLLVMRRDAGGAWGVPQVVASGASVTFDQAAIADGTGEFVAAWESYTAVCSRHCSTSNFVLHAIRVAKGDDAWSDSGALDGPRATTHSARVAIDPAGHAGAIYTVTRDDLLSIVQAGAGLAWSAPVPIYAASIAIVSGFAVDADGIATVALLDLSGAAGQVRTLAGDLGTNAWGQPVDVSGKDPSPGQVLFASSASGAAILSWAAGDPNYTNNAVRIATRSGSSGAWSRPRTISPAGAQLAAPEAAAVNADGKAVVVFSAFDRAFAVHTEYAVSN